MKQPLPDDISCVMETEILLILNVIEQVNCVVDKVRKEIG